MFVAGPDQVIPEGSVAQNVNGWATSVDDGDPELTQTLTFNVSNDNNSLFSSQPDISPAGDLTYAVAVGTAGSATVTVTLSDDGPDTAPDVNTSSAQLFTITVNPINGAPTFTIGLDQDILEDAGPQLVNGWATDIDDGDDELTQALTFDVTNDNGYDLVRRRLFRRGET